MNTNNTSTNTIENKPAICEGCATEYNGHHDERWCEDCRFVDCTMCGECVHRDDVCPHGVDGSNACDCECGECRHQEEEREIYCILVILYSILLYRPSFRR